jgi:mutator protein MutT
MKVATPVDLIIINNKNEILLAKRNEEEEGKGLWSIPGGGPENEETFDDALHREIEEELGCKIKHYKYFKSYFFKVSESLFVRSIYFWGEIKGKIKLSEELSECKWFDIEDPEISNLDFAFNQKEVLKDFIKFWKAK